MSCYCIALLCYGAQALLERYGFVCECSRCAGGSQWQGRDVDEILEDVETLDDDVEAPGRPEC